MLLEKHTEFIPFATFHPQSQKLNNFLNSANSPTRNSLLNTILA